MQYIAKSTFNYESSLFVQLELLTNTEVTVIFESKHVHITDCKQVRVYEIDFGVLGSFLVQNAKSCHFKANRGSVSSIMARNCDFLGTFT